MSRKPVIIALLFAVFFAGQCFLPARTDLSEAREKNATGGQSTDVWVSHIAFQGGWKTVLSVFYSGPETSASLTLTRIDDSGTPIESPATFDAANNTWTELPDSSLAYNGSARVQSEHGLLLKVSYRYEGSRSWCEFYVTQETRQEWILPNSVLPWFDWTGIALVNSHDFPATVILEAWKDGAKAAVQSTTLGGGSRYVKMSEAIWGSLAYRDFDTVIIRASTPIPAPICITGNYVQDRHVFFAAQPKPRNDRALCLINGTLIDGTGREPVSDSVVVIREGKILASGRRSDVAIPEQSEILDVEGGYILPGFVNAHVHNAINESNLRTWARQGVTTVRDVGAAEPVASALAFRDSVRSDPSCARLVAAGPLVTVPGGYPIVPNNFPALTVTSPEDARLKIQDLIDKGVDLIKITLEPGSGLPILTRQEVQAIVETAHGRGRPVTAHVGTSGFYRLALEAGVNDAAHSAVDFLPDDIIEGMVQAGMYLVPTLTAQRKTGETMRNLRRFLSSGGKVALGNDGGYLAGLEIGMPITEIEAMQEAGMSPMQIIVAATRNAAEVCRLDSELGTIEFGKRADILIVRGNPLENLRVLLDVSSVIHGGVVIR